MTAILMVFGDFAAAATVAGFFATMALKPRAGRPEKLAAARRRRYG